MLNLQNFKINLEGLIKSIPGLEYEFGSPGLNLPSFLTDIFYAIRRKITSADKILESNLVIIFLSEHLI